MRGRSSGWGAAAALTGFLAQASGAWAISLEDSFLTAYETNPSLISARAQLEAINEQVTQARGGLRPDVRLDFSYGGRIDDDDFRDADVTDPFSVDLNASQPLYDGGITTNATRARIADVSAARARLVELEQNVLLNVVTAYLDVWRDQEVVRLAENNVEVLSEQLRAANDRFEVGEVTRTDVSQARARLAEGEANLTLQRGQLARSRQTFQEVVGAAPGVLPAPPALPPIPASEEEAVTLALENHPQIIATRFDDTAASRDVRAAIGQLLPSVTLDGSAGFNDTALFDADENELTSASVTLRATIPLYQRGVAYSRVREAQALASQARADITVAARDRRRRAENAWTDLVVARANIRSARESVTANELAFEGVREEAFVGSRTTLDVLDAEQELLNSRTNLVGFTRDEYVASYALLEATGALTLADLDIAAVAYDPDIGYDRNNDRFFGFEQTRDTEWEELWRP